MAILFALMAFSLFKCLRTREVQLGFGGVLREDESPLLFWLAIGLQCLKLGMAFAIIYVVCFVAPNQPMS